LSPAMIRSEREAFLTDVHVGVLSVSDGRSGPLSVPVWYTYVPGATVNVVTDAGSRKASLIDAAGRFSLCAQSEAAPYKYVSVEGPVSAKEHPVSVAERREMAHRYLGQELGDMYFEATEADVPNSVVYRMSPDRWLSADFSAAFA
jgi:nitroimidazol reductase NimA-like FMN-containing flavoprotein (pyridoxamine 5'-phosphate oxidase superfamily)